MFEFELIREASSKFSQVGFECQGHMGLGLQRRIEFGFVAAFEGLGGSGNLNASLGYSVQGA